jgi:hypothetical protein
MTKGSKVSVFPGVARPDLPSDQQPRRVNPKVVEQLAQLHGAALRGEITGFVMVLGDHTRDVETIRLIDADMDLDLLHSHMMVETSTVTDLIKALANDPENEI